MKPIPFQAERGPVPTSHASPPWDALANDWDVEELAHWGLDLPIEAVDEDELESFDEEESFIIKLTCNSLEEQEKIYIELIEKGFNPNKI